MSRSFYFSKSRTILPHWLRLLSWKQNNCGSGSAYPPKLTGFIPDSARPPLFLQTSFYPTYPFLENRHLVCMWKCFNFFPLKWGFIEWNTSRQYLMILKLFKNFMSYLLKLVLPNWICSWSSAMEPLVKWFSANLYNSNSIVLLSCSMAYTTRWGYRSHEDQRTNCSVHVLCRRISTRGGMESAQGGRGYSTHLHK